MLYIAVKADIVHSRRLKERAEVQRLFLKAAESLNERFPDSLAAMFIVTHGDEAQGLLKASHADMLFPIIEYFQSLIYPVRLRFGIGIGSLSTELQRYAIGMDGEAWQKAKEAIDTAHRSKQYIEFRGYSTECEQMLSTLGNLLLFTQSKWSEEQWEAVRLMREGLSQAECAKRIGISGAAFSKRLSAAGWRQYCDGAEALKSYLVRCSSI